jgi:hypothetical protein
LEKSVDAICITTNGQYTLDGRAAMGGGCAGVCAKRWPETAVRLGKCLKNFGTNVPHIIGSLNADGDYMEPNLRIVKERKFKCLIYSFPTIDNLIDGANLDLIIQSAKLMKEQADKYGLRNIIVPRPGVGIGGLNWADVKTVIAPYLDDRFTIVSFEHEEL